jgi:hypothetical protein
MLSPQPPTRAQVEAQFVGLLDGSRSREQVDRWATQWMTLPNAGALVADQPVWWALTLLHGIDLRPSEAGPYLHDDEQLRGWLDDFRARCPQRS